MGKVRKGKGKENKNQIITIKIVCNSAAFAVGAGVDCVKGCSQKGLLKMELSCNEQRCLNGILAEVGS